MSTAKATKIVINNNVRPYQVGVSRYALGLLQQWATSPFKTVGVISAVSIPSQFTRYPNYFGPLCDRFLLMDRIADVWLRCLRADVAFSPFPSNLTWSGRHVVAFHDCILERFPEYYPRSDPFVRDQLVARRKSLERCTSIIAISKQTVADLRYFYADICLPPIHLVPHGVDQRLFTPHGSTFNHPRPYALYVGDRHKYKNFPALLNALGTSQRLRDIDLLIASRLPFDDKERKLIQQLRLGQRIHLLKNVTDSLLASLYRGGRCLVSTSAYEGFGLPILEALACGTPLAAARIPTTVEVAGSLPVYFEGANPESIGEAIASASSKCESELGQYRVRAAAIASRFTWNNCADLTWHVIEECARQ